MTVESRTSRTSNRFYLVGSNLFGRSRHGFYPTSTSSWTVGTVGNSTRCEHVVHSGEGLQSPFSQQHEGKDATHSRCHCPTTAFREARYCRINKSGESSTRGRTGGPHNHAPNHAPNRRRLS